MTTPMTPDGFNLSYMTSMDYLSNPEKYAHQELIRKYGFATTPEAKAIYAQAISRANETIPLDQWIKSSCTIL